VQGHPGCTRLQQAVAQAPGVWVLGTNQLLQRPNRLKSRRHYELAAERSQTTVNLMRDDVSVSKVLRRVDLIEAFDRLTGYNDTNAWMQREALTVN